MRFYAIADIVFVAGSLAKNGGHNILEPAALGKPVLFGPHMFNFRDIADLFLENQAALLVQDKKELCAKVKDLLNEPEKIELLSNRARELVLAHQGATQKATQLIKELCKNISTV
jgi:3-deoxy-D-manno-octulosonic-acid transferase